MPYKRINRGFVLGVALAVLLVLVFVFSLIFGLKMQPNEIITKKFYIPIKEEYEIVKFKKEESLEKHYKAELKISERDYYAFLSELEEAGYYSQAFDEDFYLEDWVDGKNVVNIYTKATKERYLLIYGNRIHINVTITEAIDGYYHIYMSR